MNDVISDRVPVKRDSHQIHNKYSPSLLFTRFSSKIDTLLIPTLKVPRRIPNLSKKWLQILSLSLSGEELRQASAKQTSVTSYPALNNAHRYSQSIEQIANNNTCRQLKDQLVQKFNRRTMLLRGSILLAALLTVASGGGFAANAVPIKEITEDVIDGGDEQQLNSRELQSRYGVQPNYPAANRYNEAKKNTPDPTPKPSSYSAPSSGTGRRGNLTVYTDDDGRKYVFRFRNGVKNKVYMDTPGWNAGGRRQRTGVRPSGNNNGSRVRTGNSNRRWRRPGGTMPRRKRPDDWSAPTPSKKPTPTPTKWTSGGSGWRPKPEIPSYSGGYDNSYHDPTLGPTMVPTWDNDGFGNCVEVSKKVVCLFLLFRIHTNKYILTDVFFPFCQLNYISHSNRLAATKRSITHLIRSKVSARSSTVISVTVTRMVILGGLETSLLRSLPGIRMVGMVMTGRIIRLRMSVL